jgi:hypothetical protein
VNRYARPAKKGYSPRDDDDEEEQSSSITPDVVPIGSHHLMSITPLGRPPRGEEEKRAVFLDLLRLKENRKTNRECADTLGVSERTVANYLIDPLYQELYQTIIADATQQGRLLISDVIPAAINKHYTLMMTARSEFVQYKCAEYLLKISGFEQEQQVVERDNQGEVIAFLNKLKDRPSKVQVNVTVNQQGQSGGQVIDADVVDVPAFPVASEDDLSQYSVPMLPGGKIPTGEQK